MYFMAQHEHLCNVCSQSSGFGFFFDRTPAEKNYLELIRTCKRSSLPSLQGEVLPKSLFVQSYHVPTDQ